MKIDFRESWRDFTLRQVFSWYCKLSPSVKHKSKTSTYLKFRNTPGTIILWLFRVGTTTLVSVPPWKSFINDPNSYIESNSNSVSICSSPSCTNHSGPSGANKTPSTCSSIIDPTWIPTSKNILRSTTLTLPITPTLLVTWPEKCWLENNALSLVHFLNASPDQVQCSVLSIVPDQKAIILIRNIKRNL